MSQSHIGIQGSRAIAFAILFCAFLGNLAAAEKIKINVRQSDGAIRLQLIRLTPVGTDIHQVYQFLDSRVHRDSRVIGGPMEPRPFSTGLATELGHYYERRSPSEGLFLFPTVVKAFWEFDERHKLRDIRVQRFIRGW
jgi:hypothetical protein